MELTGSCRDGKSERAGVERTTDAAAGTRRRSWTRQLSRDRHAAAADDDDDEDENEAALLVVSAAAFSPH
ncbi:hypothetical protein PAAG_11071 [Paracoccidioides lutzii Pb01]|uniref:Uncharacterized protein n=1 Tax=Paracoccidioides lutzii (strain ATCC MYA-826 / Pb01) TaxID=502779 RepID=A0A0A2V7R6_PARBA|nr:hypothetical protein PAAG_11071 [Paracoccidioides lutzii Pb01]KGQ02120.1 hypothetical protein PAAG_11071 [Paracoccidioides lutzii Pb01]